MILSEEEFLIEELDCAKLLGMSLEEYRESLKHIEINKCDDSKPREYDYSILEKLGLTVDDLKRRESV